MIFVIDTETTGDGPDDKVIEVAAWSLDLYWRREPSPAFDTQVALEGESIHVEAKATHHITESMLKGAPDRTTVGDALRVSFHENDYVAAHNMPFDARLLAQTWPDLQLPHPVCTYKCAKHLYPDAPRHSNQVLRYWLDLGIYYSGDAHSAAFDAYVTAKLLQKMLESRNIEELYRLTNQPVLLKTISFGKHKGLLWEKVPRDYLAWLLRQSDLDEDTKHTAQHWMRA